MTCLPYSFAFGISNGKSKDLSLRLLVIFMKRKQSIRNDVGSTIEKVVDKHSDFKNVFDVGDFYWVGFHDSTAINQYKEIEEDYKDILSYATDRVGPILEDIGSHARVRKDPKHVSSLLFITGMKENPTSYESKQENIKRFLTGNTSYRLENGLSPHPRIILECQIRHAKDGLRQATKDESLVQKLDSLQK